jgi:hypothetical protein
MGVAVVTLAIGDLAESLLPRYHNYIGFWLVAGALSLITAMSFAISGLRGPRPRLAAGRLCILAMSEGAFFVATFNRTVPTSEAPPPSAAMAWLAAHASGHPVAAVGQAIVPEAAVLCGVSDVRAYEILIDSREAQYWSAADPGFTDARSYMEFDQPGVDWLAAAGVAYVMTPSNATLAGTSIAYDPYQPGWSATLDGSSARVLPPNVLFMARRVPAGHHTLDLYYLPVSVVGGGIASAVGVLFLAVLILIAVRTRANKAPLNQ